MTTDQFRSIVERLIAILLTWLIAKGYLSSSDAVQYGPLVVGLAVSLWAYYMNRPISLAQRTVASIPNTTIVTDPEISKVAPEENIVSNVTNMVNKR
jgi:hypothetical protein